MSEEPAVRVFDTHFHIIDPRFPVMENQGFLPPVFTVEDYRARTGGLGFRLWSAYLDLSGGATFNREDVQTDTNDFVSLPTRINLGLTLKWERSL